MENNTSSFLEWLDEEIERRGISQNWVEEHAYDLKGKPLSRGTISSAKAGQRPKAPEKRKITAEHAIRIARALRLEPLQVLYLAGYISKEEVSLAKNFIPDNQQLYRLWIALKEMSEFQLELCEKPILALLEACIQATGGEAEAITGEEKADFG